MSHAFVKRLGSAAVVLAIILGCNTIFQSGNDQGGEDFSSVDSDFSDAPVSPGGTGGSDDGGDDGGADGGGVELPSETTRSFFTAFQIDPVEEDTAGPKFVVAGDVDQDGLLDLVSAWNQSQPIQLHLQRRDAADNISFRTVTLAGTTPIAVVAGLALGQINGDGWLDVVVLVKATGRTGLCPTSPPEEISALEGEIVILFSPGIATLIPDGDNWSEVLLVNPYVQDRWIHNHFPGDENVSFDELQTKPENGGFTALAVGDIDQDGYDDILAALNPGECKELGQEPPVNTVDLWMNPGVTAEDASQWGVDADIELSRGVPVTVMIDAPQVSDITLDDIDGDGDLDVVAAYTNSISWNIRWARNPYFPHQTGGAGGRAAVTAGASDGGPNICVGGVNDEGVCGDDADCVGVADGTCRSSVCVGGGSPGASCTDDNECPGVEDGVCTPQSWHFMASGWQARPVGQVDTGANKLTIGDVDSDGSNDVLVRSTVGQIVQWFRRPNTVVLPPEFPPSDPVPDRYDFPWTVYTLTEFTEQEPEAIAIDDVTGDGQVEVMVAVEGGVFWYDGTVGDTLYDPWYAHTIIQDSPAETTEPDGSSDGDAETQQPGGTGVGATEVDASTNINALLVVDLDGDDRKDIVATLDRRSGAGLSDDRLVWYRNTKSDSAPPP